VREIKQRLHVGWRLRRLADAYGVHIMTISDIKRGATWKHIA
jgi:uncharacterized protein YjcR